MKRIGARRCRFLFSATLPVRGRVVRVTPRTARSGCATGGEHCQRGREPFGEGERRAHFRHEPPRAGDLVVKCWSKLRIGTAFAAICVERENSDEQTLQNNDELGGAAVCDMRKR